MSSKSCSRWQGVGVPSIEFDKYKKWGDYHWKEFRRNSAYRHHALKVQSWITEKTGLDVGCGDGLITHLLGPGWTGIDVDQLAVKLARQHGVAACEGNIYDVGSLARKFEAIYCGDVLEHLKHPATAAHAMSEITDTLYLVTPPRIGNLRVHHVQEWTADELVVFMANLDWQLEGTVSIENDRMYGRFVLCK